VRFADAASLFELTFPAMVLRASALESNVATMAAWCRSHGVELAPHGKTSMSPEVTYRQLAAGAWGITAATIDQVRTFVEMGVRRALMANQLVDPAGIAWLASALTANPSLTVIGYVDSVAGVALLDRSLAAAGLSRRLPVLVEIGVQGKRTGVRTLAEGAAVARAAASTETLAVVGCSAFEGVVGHDRDQAAMDAVAALCSSVRQLGLELAESGVISGPPILSAGGSTYFDVVASSLSGPEPATVVLRSGGYVTHDDGLYSVATPLPSDLQPAIDVWAYVLSRPEPGRRSCVPPRRWRVSSATCRASRWCR
jgi:D-serine dehydratase